MANETESDRRRIDDEIASIIPPARTLSQLIAYMGEGFDIAAGQELQAMLAEIENQALDGAKEVKFKVKLELKGKRGNDGVYEIVPTIVIDLPKRSYGRTILWADRDHNFTPANPRQMQMNFRQVESGRPTRTIT